MIWVYLLIWLTIMIRMRTWQQDGRFGPWFKILSATVTDKDGNETHYTAEELAAIR